MSNSISIHIDGPRPEFINWRPPASMNEKIHLEVRNGKLTIQTRNYLGIGEYRVLVNSSYDVKGARVTIADHWTLLQEVARS